MNLSRLEDALIDICQLVDKLTPAAKAAALTEMDLSDHAFESDMDVIREFCDYDPNDLMLDDDDINDDFEEDP